MERERTIHLMISQPGLTRQALHKLPGIDPNYLLIVSHRESSKLWEPCKMHSGKQDLTDCIKNKHITPTDWKKLKTNCLSLWCFFKD